MSYEFEGDMADMVDGPAVDTAEANDIAVPEVATSDDAASLASATPSVEEKPAKLSRKEAKAARKAAAQGPSAGNPDPGPEGDATQTTTAKAAASRARRRALRNVPVRTAFDFTAGRYTKVRRTRLMILALTAAILSAVLLLIGAGFTSVQQAQGIHDEATSMIRATQTLQAEIDELASVNGVSGAAITADVEARSAAADIVMSADVPTMRILDIFTETANHFGVLTSFETSPAIEGRVDVHMSLNGETNADARNLRDALRAIPAFTDVALTPSGSFGELTFAVTLVADLTALGAGA